MTTRTFASITVALVLVAWLAGAGRLLAPFIASAGVIAATAASQQAAVARTSAVAYAVCVLLGGLAHALLPQHPAAEVALALGGFLVLRAAGRAHAPALAMLVVVYLTGVSAADVAALAGLATALQAGTWFAGAMTEQA